MQCFRDVVPVEAKRGRQHGQTQGKLGNLETVDQANVVEKIVSKLLIFVPFSHWTSVSLKSPVCLPVCLASITTVATDAQYQFSCLLATNIRNQDGFD